MADNFFKIRNGISLGNLPTDPANPESGDFYYNTTSNQFRGYQSGTWQNFPLGSSGANQYLSNLLSPTAINQHLIPGSDNNYTLGGGGPGTSTNPGNAWEILNSYQIYTLLVKSPSTSGVALSPPSAEIDFGSGAATGNSGAATLTTGLSSAMSGAIFIQTGGAQTGSGAMTIKSGASNTGATGAVLISTGIASSGNSGSLTLSTGTASGSRGKLFLGPSASVNLATQFASDPVSGMVAGDFYYNTTDQSIHYYNGTAWLSLATGGTAANTTLSNLTSPTAINQDLLPQSDASNNLGNSSTVWNILYTRNIFGEVGQTLSVTGDTVSISSNNEPASTGDVSLSTGNAGTGDSGDIALTTGTSSGGSQGRVLISARAFGLPEAASDPLVAAAGDEYYNTTDNTIHYYNGTAWFSLATGSAAANVNLSNLASPTAINQDLLPDADETRDLGSPSLRWNELWTISVVNPAGQLLLSGTSGISVNSNVISNAGTPLVATDVANKAYVDNLALGLNWKETVVSATTAPLPGTYAYNNGASGVNATITQNGTIAGNPLNPQDGVTLSVGQRFLVQDEISGNAPYNGIYTVTQVGDGATIPYILTRATAADTAAGLQWSIVQVGPDASTQGGFLYRESNDITTIGTDPVAFTLISQGINWQFINGLSVSGNQVNVAPGDASLLSTAGSLIVQESPTGAIQTGVTGIYVNVDGTSIDINGSNQVEIKASGVANSMLAPMPAHTLKGNNTASSANPLDLTVAQVTAMIGVEAATASSLVERDASANIYINQANAQAPSGPQIRLSTDGSNWLEVQYVDNISIPDNQSAAADVDPSLDFDWSVYAGYMAEYYINDGQTPADTRIGTITVTSLSDGSAASLTDNSTDANDVGVTFSWATVGSTIQLQAVTTSIGTARTMRVKITRFRI